MIDRLKSSLEFNKKFNINVDLAVEAREIVRGQTGTEIPGVVVNKEEYENAEVTIVEIVDEGATQIMGKPVGTYITLDAPSIRENNKLIHHQISQILADQIQKVAKLSENDSVLLVGLGNWNATPDALGPKVIDLSLVTRHLHQYAPEELSGGLRQVSAIAPGVLGITGVETAEIIHGVVDKIKPDLIIAIDALASQSPSRISTTIQIADTGINPGSGIGNKRKAINQEIMGVPVIAVGVPTVVNAAVISQETINKLLMELQVNPNLQQLYKGLNPIILNNIIELVLEPFAGNLMVTPKEIDELILNTAKIIAGALSIALHPGITSEDYTYYMQ